MAEVLKLKVPEEVSKEELKAPMEEVSKEGELQLKAPMEEASKEELKVPKEVVPKEELAKEERLMVLSGKHVSVGLLQYPCCIESAVQLEKNSD